MKKCVLSAVIGCAVSLACSAVQSSAERYDALGAHANYGRGCSACHAQHSPAFRNDDGTVPARIALWGEDKPDPYKSDDSDSLPSDGSPHSPETRGVLLCLSCHNGDYAAHAMMKNTVYEKIPETLGGSDSIPTFAERTNLDLASQFGEHPIGLDAQIGCGSAHSWDCTQSHGALRMAGLRSSQFVTNYGFFIKPRTYHDKSIVVCTTCHNPHSMTMTAVTTKTASALYQPGVYSTKHFLRAPYGENNPSPTSNLSAQFCRQCHAEMSNEMNGSTAGTIL